MAGPLQSIVEQDPLDWSKRQSGPEVVGMPLREDDSERADILAKIVECGRTLDEQPIPKYASCVVTEAAARELGYEGDWPPPNSVPWGSEDEIVDLGDGDG